MDHETVKSLYSLSLCIVVELLVVSNWKVEYDIINKHLSGFFLHIWLNNQGNNVLHFSNNQLVNDFVVNQGTCIIIQNNNSKKMQVF